MSANRVSGDPVMAAVLSRQIEQTLSSEFSGTILNYFTGTLVLLIKFGDSGGV